MQKLYFMRATKAGESVVKVGVSVDVESRRRSLESFCRTKIDILAVFEVDSLTMRGLPVDARVLEQRLHSVLGKHQIKNDGWGIEWFEQNAALNVMYFLSRHLPIYKFADDVDYQHDSALWIRFCDVMNEINEFDLPSYPHVKFFDKVAVQGDVIHCNPDFLILVPCYYKDWRTIYFIQHHLCPVLPYDWHWCAFQTVVSGFGFWKESSFGRKYCFISGNSGLTASGVDVAHTHSKNSYVSMPSSRETIAYLEGVGVKEFADTLYNRHFKLSSKVFFAPVPYSKAYDPYDIIK